MGMVYKCQGSWQHGSPSRKYRQKYTCILKCVLTIYSVVTSNFLAFKHLCELIPPLIKAVWCVSLVTG